MLRFLCVVFAEVTFPASHRGSPRAFEEPLTDALPLGAHFTQLLSNASPLKEYSSNSMRARFLKPEKREVIKHDRWLLLTGGLSSVACFGCARIPLSFLGEISPPFWSS
jgi:hypothetical protein